MSINKTIEFVGQDGGGTGEIAGRRWVVRDVDGDKLGEGEIIKGFLVHAPDTGEGWVEIWDSSERVNEATVPSLFRFQAITGHTEHILFSKENQYKVRNGLYLHKDNATRVHVLIG